MADDPSLPYGPDTITTRFSMRVAVTFRRIRGRPGGNAQVERSTGDVASEQMVLLPPMSAEAERRFCAWLAANATPEPARRTAPEPWSALTKVYGNPNLGISGAADDEMTLWRRRTDKAEPEPLAALRLHLVGSEPSELYAGQRFAGLLWQAPDRALLHPEWLRDIGAVGPEPDNRIRANHRSKSIRSRCKYFRRGRRRRRKWSAITARRCPCPSRALWACHPAAPPPRRRTTRAAHGLRVRRPDRTCFRTGSQARMRSRVSVGNFARAWRLPDTRTCTRPCAGVPLPARTTARARRSTPGARVTSTSLWQVHLCFNAARNLV